MPSIPEEQSAAERDSPPEALHTVTLRRAPQQTRAGIRVRAAGDSEATAGQRRVPLPVSKGF